MLERFSSTFALWIPCGPIAPTGAWIPWVLDGKVLYLSYVLKQWALEDANAWPDLISTFRNAAELGFLNESWVRKDLDKVTSQYLPKDPKKGPHDKSPAPSPRRPRIDTQSESRSSPPRHRVCNEEAVWTCGSDDSGTCEWSAIPDLWCN